MRKPVNDLSRGALVDDIVHTIALTAIQRFPTAAVTVVLMPDGGVNACPGLQVKSRRCGRIRRASTPSDILLFTLQSGILLNCAASITIPFSSHIF